MHSILQGLGFFIYPFLVCSIVGTYIFFERWVALRHSKVLPLNFWENFWSRGIEEMSIPLDSVVGRLLLFAKQKPATIDALCAFIDAELSRMEGGLYLLGSIVSIAPLLGLLGTVLGLIEVFAKISLGSQEMQTQDFISGIALALTTTMVGLSIAIPAVLAYNFLNRVLEKYAARLYLIAQQLAVGTDEKGDIA